MILAIKTDTFDSEIYILDVTGNPLDSLQWHAGRELSTHLLSKINKLLSDNNIELNHLSGVIVYKGPGSFTGLRIGIAVANSLGYGLKIPVVGATSKAWLEYGVDNLVSKKKYVPVSPVYGSEPHITKPRK